ncbi:MAG: hypothetical protein LBT05_14235 [Planctomycetaceae bacterium]|jgi:hypothetical protein|nr:hypothetical protein [Planctomycetaceae bacterium]
MGIHELREKYGNVKGCQAVNDAVRNELSGGNRIMSLTAWLFRQDNLTEREQTILSALLTIQKEMKQSIIKKYQLNQE